MTARYPKTTHLFSAGAPRQPTRPLTEIKVKALCVMMHGPLDRKPKGWVSRAGVEHEPFNSHTIGWLGQRGYCSVGSKSCSISARGEAIAVEVEEYGVAPEFAEPEAA